MENKKEIKDFRCKGRIPGTNKPCEKVLFKTDGEYIFVDAGGGNVLEIKLKRRVDLIKCYNCGYQNRYYGK